MAKSISRHSRVRGFTLIELLVAISILAMVAVLGWRGLDGIVRARLALNHELAQTRGMQLTFAQLQSDCSRLTSASVVANRQVLALDENRLIMIRNVYADDQPARVQIVLYRLRDGVLSRQESAATRDLSELDALWQAGLEDKIPNPAIALQSDVALFSMRTWDARRPGWQKNANLVPTSANPAVAAVAAIQSGPIGLEVSLQLHSQSASMIKIFLLGPV
ncbi:MAG: prepilin-type N-terminal cleavage/methylation domain-containing protein [Herbaspirillum sp.]